MTQRMSHSSARLHASRVPHAPRALSHSANLLMVPHMQALMTRLSRRACRSACENKDRGKELFLSSVVAPPGTGFCNRAESSMAQNEDVLGRETEARKLFIVELSEPRPYALLEPEQACAPGSIWLSALWPGAMPRRELDGHRQPPDFVAGGPTSARGLAHQPDASSRLDPS